MPYTGIFVRQNIGQTPSQLGQGSCFSPDIIVDNSFPQAPAPGSYATLADYNAPTAHPNQATMNNENYVYLRGLQANGYTGGTNFFLYYVESDLALWPKNWTLLQKITVGSANPPGSYENWAYAPNPVPGSTNQIVMVDQPILWTPDPPAAGQHFCLICWADNSTESNPIPPDWNLYNQMASFNDLMYFLGQNPNMGWLNTQDFIQPPPGDIYQTNITAIDAETLNITVNFYNISTGTFSVNLLGNNISYNSGTLNVVNYTGGFQLPQQAIPANTSATLQVFYNNGGQPMNPYARIDATLQKVVSAEMMASFEPMLATPGSYLPIKRMRLAMYDGELGDTEDVFPLGTQSWNLNF